MTKTKIRVEDLVMIFGKSPHKEALPLLRDGISKEDILSRTGHVVGVANASFSVQEGEIFVVMGLSGSGKSTLIRCINRLIEPTAGRVLVDDEDVLVADKQRLRDMRRTKMSMVFQHFALMPHKTVLENVAYGLKVRGLPENEQHQKAQEALELVGLQEWAKRYPKNLSGGMQQRVGLARALATEADILLMDEAFSALDPLIRRQMQNELLKLQERLHKTVLFITHDLNEALRVGNNIAIMRAGQIIQIGSPVEILTQPADDYVAAFVQDVDYGRVLTAEVVMKPANTLTMGRDMVQTALKRMKAKDNESAWYVVNHQQQPTGLLHRKDLMKVVENGQSDVSNMIEQSFPTTESNTSLADIYTLCAAGLPVAVLDKAGRLQGVIHPLDILSTLATNEQVDYAGGNGATP